MSLEKELNKRSGSACELCAGTEGLVAYQVPPENNGKADTCILTCGTCFDQMENPEKVDVNHWRCLNDSIWNETPAVKVVSWRMLNQLKSEGWTQDLIDMMYMEEETEKWAKELEEANANKVIHKDSNGVVLNSGDSVVIIKDLNVKGSSMVAKRGTAVRRISLVHDNPEHIEGRVNDQHIVILTKFVKKTK